MSEEVKYLPYELALQIVGNVIEEEHLHEPERRVLTVYDKSGRELCWYDADEIMAEIGATRINDEAKSAAVERIMHQIPEWVKG
jgi:hypothetical protein